jgi:pimeloyl-ACP methyl ester carboxylesterase
VLEPIQTATSVDGQIEELREDLMRAAHTPAVLIGFSWGAWLSLLTASRYPELAAKLILVSCGVLTESYVAELHSRRRSRLDESERAQFDTAIAGLNDPAAQGKDALLAQLGKLASKADAYAPIDDSEDVPSITLNGEIYRQVWTEAAELRRTGSLLRQAARVACPVTAIHGDSDPSPAAGVSEPLSAALNNFRMIILPKCGHTPWRERYAREEFYSLVFSEVG